MKNKKGLLGIGIMALVMIVTSVMLGIQASKNNEQIFEKAGYIIKANEQSESEQFAFIQGTKYEKSISEGYSFEDISGKKVEIEQSSFVHYEDESISALSKGVLMNIADLKKVGAIQHYAIPSGMLLEKNGSAYRLQSETGTIDMKEGIWKISDTRFLLFGSDLEVVFDEKDIRKAGDFIEINYIDEGVVQIITKENVWQSVSTSAYIKTKEGSKLKLFDQIIEKDDNQMTLNKLVISSDNNITLSPLETRNQQVPKFNVKSEDGENGEGGEAGDKGNAGDQGALGNTGKNGSKGDKGTLGTTGDSGSNGTNGKNGSSGESGGNGTNGGKGKPGQSGTDAGQETTAKTGLPQFSIQNWKVTSVGLSGSLKIVDENIMLTSDSATIVIYEAGSGERYPCVNENGEEDFNVQGESVSFHTDTSTHPLKPDTEYRLVVSAKYEMNNQLFEREFISRVFYTDSLGIFMEKENVTTDSIAITVSKKEYSKVIKADIYVLTQQQAETFSLQSTASYIKKSVDMSSGDFIDETVSFDSESYDVIKSNKKFVIRMVAYEEVQTYLSNQSLNVTTLKKTPTFNEDLYVIRNKPMKGFELYSGALKDEDHAVLQQRYEIYDADESSDHYDELVKSIEIEPGSGLEATMLLIDKKLIFTSHPYKFRIVTTYNDNEKIIEKVSAFSERFQMKESYLPALSLQSDQVEYDTLSGQLIIDLNGSALTLSQKEPLIIQIDCEGVYTKTIQITSKDDAMIAQYGDQIILNFNENGLKADSVYRFRVSGYVDLKDGDGAQGYVIGNVVKATKKLNTIKADWKVNQSSSYAVSRVLKLQAEDNSWDQGMTYEAKSLSKVIIELYKGSGNGKVFMNQISFTDTDSDPRTSSIAEDFIVNGKEISEIDFGYKANSLTDTIYTMRIHAVYDYTGLEGYYDVNNVSGYQNQYEVSESTREVIVTKASQPPALPEADLTSNQVKATPIYNKDAGIYGKSVDQKLEDDTIVGYRLEASYDNYAKLARTMYYYAFESNQYDDLMKNNENPIYQDRALLTSGDWVYRKAIPVSTTSSTVPVCAVFFGEGKDTTYNGVNVTYGGPVESNASALLSGMARGYKYTFAYAISYNEIGAGEGNKIYPYEHPQYQSIAEKLKQPYVLNSGVKEAPKSEPSFVIYPYDSTNQGNSISLTLKYRYTDADHTIEKGVTRFIHNGEYNDAIQVGEATWGSVTFPTILSSTLQSGQFIPQISRKLYNLTYAKESNTLNVMYQPLDFSSTFTQASVTSLQYEVIPDLERNQIGIKLKDSADHTYLENYHKKVAGIRAIFYEIEDEQHTYQTYLTLNEANTAYLSSAKLESLLGKNIGVKVSLVYDINAIGWHRGSTGEKFALQMVNTRGGVYSLGNYLAYDDLSGTLTSSDTDAIGSLFTQKGWPDLDQIETTQVLNFATPLRTGSAYYYDVRAEKNGIGRITGASLANYNVSYMVARTLRESSLTLDESQQFNLTKIVPSISMDDLYNQNMTSVVLKGVDISGSNQIDVNDKGKREVVIHIKDLSTQQEQQQIIEVSGSSSIRDITLSGLKRDTAYRLTFTASIQGTNTELLDGKTSSIFTKDIKTKGSVNILQLKTQYKVENYDTQRMKVTYFLDQVSGFILRYSILDEDGNVIMNNQEMIDAQMYEGYQVGDTYQTSMDVDMLLLITKHKLKIDQDYQLKVTAYQVSDGIVDENEVLGSAQSKFHISTASTPIIFTNMVPEYSEDSKKIDMKIDTSLADAAKVIMSDYQVEDGNDAVYYIRYYEKKQNEWVDITDEKEKYQVYEAGKNYSKTLETVKANTYYRVAVYAAIDTNRDGMCDQNPDVTGSIASIDKEAFEKDKDTYLLWEDVRMTPGENGIAYGDVSVENPNRDPSKIAMGYKGASNLNSIKKVEYTVISSDGKNSYTGTLMNNDGSLFVEKVSGYYTMELPVDLESVGYYRITLMYYLKNGEVYEKTDSYSTTYLYEK